jgi:hypothetical protein
MKEWKRWSRIAAKAMTLEARKAVSPASERARCKRENGLDIREPRSECHYYDGLSPQGHLKA